MKGRDVAPWMFLICVLGFPSLSRPAATVTETAQTDPAVKADFETLTNWLLPFARQQLAKYGEFYPVGAVVTVAGELRPSAYQPSSDHPPSQEVIDGLVDGFRMEAKKKEIRATAIVLDVLVRRPGAATKSDAMEVRLEHVSGVARTVHVPYELSAARRLEEGASFETSAKPVVFETR